MLNNAEVDYKHNLKFPFTAFFNAHFYASRWLPYFQFLSDFV